MEFEGSISENGGVICLDEGQFINGITLNHQDLPVDVDVEDATDDDDEDSSSDGMPEGEPDDDDSIHVPKLPKKSVYKVDCSPTDSSLVASVGRDNFASLWRLFQQDSDIKLGGQNDTVASLAFSSDGQLLATGGLDASVKIWDASGNLKWTFDGPAAGNKFEWVRWHPSQHKVLAGCTDRTARLWNADDGSSLNIFQGHQDDVTCGDLSPDGETACTGSWDTTLRIYNLRSGDVQLRGFISALNCLTYTSDSTRILFGTNDGSLCMLHIPTQTMNRIRYHSGSIGCMGLSSSFPWLATGGQDKKLVIHDLEHSAPLSLCEHKDTVTCLKWLGESRYVASGCDDGRIIIWDARSGECARNLGSFSASIQSLSVSADRQVLVAASEDGKIRYYYDISRLP